MHARAAVVAVLVVVAGVAPVVAAGTGTQQGKAYSGTHVSFDTANDAVVDYAVNGETVVDSVKVQSRSKVENSDIGLSGGLGAVTNFQAAGISLASQTEVRATVQIQSGAEMRSHDNSRGVFVVDAGGTAQYVSANLSSNSQANQAGEKRVVVTSGDGTKGAFLVVGDGKVTVNDGDNVTARLGQNGKLVYRAYPEGRSDGDEQQEQLITSGTAAAEVYVVRAKEGGDRVADVVSYSQDTTVEVTEQSQGTLEMTAERSQSQGKVILCTLQESAFGAAEEIQVSVDGEAAAKTSSYGELQSATQNGEQSRYLVRQQSSAQAATDVAVAVNHFSSREVTVSDGGGGGDGTGTSMPGFGVVVTLAALAAALLARARFER